MLRRVLVARAKHLSRNPLWRLLDALRRPARLLPLSEALHASAVSVSEFSRWNFVLKQPAIDSAALDTAPSWVLLYLVTYKVRSAQHAHGPMLDLVYAHLDTAPKEIHGPLLLIAAVQLARFGLVVPLRRLATTFLTVWIDNPTAYFNWMLQVISSIPNRTVESATIAVLLLKAMESRQLKLTSQTYQMLLDDRFVTLQLTKYLQSRMVQDGFVPSTSHLESYLRFFAKDGAIHDAKKYYNAIHAQSTPFDDKTFFLNPSSIPQVRANTLMLGTHHSAQSAFGFLRKLAAQTPQSTVVLPSSTPRNTRTLNRIFRIKFRNIYDFTSTLNVLVHDSRCTPSHLLKFFRKVPGGRPTIAVYTLLIRGLLLKNDTVNAVSYWKKLLKTGLAIDSEALTTGIVALTRIGRPYDAFLLLEQYGSHSGKSKKKLQLRHPIQVTQKTINDFMVALIRIQRPDMVFRMWDYMDVLYGVKPNAFSLSVLLQAARLAYRLDDTISGAIAQLSLYNPFRKRKLSSLSVSRQNAILEITNLVWDNKTKEARAYTSGVWRNEEPMNAVKKIFVQVVFGVAGESGGEERVEEMVKLKSPAKAARRDVSEDLAEGLGFGFRKLRGVKYVFKPFGDLVLRDSDTTPRSHYPSIFPTNANCLHYILLLTLSKRSFEIPLLLQWMKFLGIQPSNSTLALALAVWREVSCQAPLIESFQRVVTTQNNNNNNNSSREYENEGREFGRLVKWIGEWVGEERVPKGEDVGKWMRILREVREVKS
ncbi:hypothetical protein Agabi119p4_11375 [Agaricus bisporus var. burnettii]|uniref:Pentatricopeptide repeat-containing protein n=1 Tax=Agaricus bisporus var. burnettii TaxID=192524 RepID=A0A8H7C019_AGABI|nr:hypothetical protein Agabi119p4_11375 [Agaricus bisporus var. burnettii]